MTSARVALALNRKGIVRVRPLLGGLHAWLQHQYPVELLVSATTCAATR